MFNLIAAGKSIISRAGYEEEKIYQRWQETGEILYPEDYHFFFETLLDCAVKHHDPTFARQIQITRKNARFEYPDDVIQSWKESGDLTWLEILFHEADYVDIWCLYQNAGAKTPNAIWDEYQMDGELLEKYWEFVQAHPSKMAKILAACYQNDLDGFLALADPDQVTPQLVYDSYCKDLPEDILHQVGYYLTHETPDVISGDLAKEIAVQVHTACSNKNTRALQLILPLTRNLDWDSFSMTDWAWFAKNHESRGSLIDTAVLALYESRYNPEHKPLILEHLYHPDLLTAYDCFILDSAIFSNFGNTENSQEFQKFYPPNRDFILFDEGLAFRHDLPHKENSNTMGHFVKNSHRGYDIYLDTYYRLNSLDQYKKERDSWEATQLAKIRAAIDQLLD